MKSLDLIESSNHNRAFLINPRGRIISIFIFEKDTNFVDGWLYRLDSWSDDEIVDLSSNYIEKLNHLDISYIPAEEICKMYVKYDGNGHLWFHQDDGEPTTEVYIYGMDETFIRALLFVNEISRMAHSFTDDLKEIKDTVLKDHKIVICEVKNKG
jgi:hypothetical protein